MRLTKAGVVAAFDDYDILESIEDAIYCENVILVSKETGVTISARGCFESETGALAFPEGKTKVTVRTLKEGVPTVTLRTNTTKEINTTQRELDQDWIIVGIEDEDEFRDVRKRLNSFIKLAHSQSERVTERRELVSSPAPERELVDYPVATVTRRGIPAISKDQNGFKL